MLWYQLSPILWATGFDGDPITGAEICEVKEDNTPLTEEAVGVGSMTSGEWYQDRTNDILYLIAPDDSNPNTNGKTYVAYTWLGFTNNQESGSEICFEIQGRDALYYKPAIQSSRMGTVKSAITDFWQSNITIDVGDVVFTNTAWWYENRDSYLWHFADVAIKTGDQETAYGSFTDVFYGALKEPRYSDKEIVIGLEDIRWRELTWIPIDTYSTDDYPDMAEDYVGYPIPILFGQKSNITPIEIDDTIYKYKICQTVFNGTTYAINAINNVYKDGVALATPADYSEDLNNGEFTLTADPGDSEITCGANGIKCHYDFAGNSFDGVASTNAAEFVLFLINVVKNVPDARIDFSAFETLRDNKSTVTCADYIHEEIEFREWIKLAQASIQFNLLPSVDGQITVKEYIVSDAASITYDTVVTPDGGIYSDMLNFQSPESSTVYSKIAINYNYRPTAGTWKTATVEDTSIGYKYQQTGTLTLDTIIRNAESAGDMASIYLNFFKVPAEYVSFISTGQYEDFDMLAMDKILLSRTILDGDGNEVDIYDGETFLVKDVEKNLSDGTKIITGRKDVAQARGDYLLQLNGDKLLQISGDAILT